MFAVSISIGGVSSYVSVAPVPQPQDGAASTVAAPIKVIANSAGHRNTPVAAALTEQEVLFGENAMHCFMRQPQVVVPMLFSFAAAAAANADVSRSQDATEKQRSENLLEVIEQGAREKYRGHCSLEQRELADGVHRSGFTYETQDANGETTEQFMSAEDLFVQFLNYVKEHSVDGACGLTVGGGEPSEKDKKGDRGSKRRPLTLTIVVPRYAFPGIADSRSESIGSARSGSRERQDAVEWLLEAVRASHFDSVTSDVSVLFSDEAAILAFDSVPREVTAPYFLLPPTAAAPAHGARSMPRPVEKASVLVVDWGARALNLSLMQLSGGAVTQTRNGTPYLSCSSCSDSASYFCGTSRCRGGDAIDVALAEKIAAHYIVTNRRLFQGAISNVRPLQDFVSNSSSPSADSARQLITETIPARAMRRLRVLMGDKKIALNTNPQAMSVAVEMEAFYEGMDLMDSTSLTRNKFESAVLSEWSCVDRFEAALAEFVRRHSSAVETAKINYVLLTGGMCQMPSIVQGLRRVFRSPRNAEVQASLARSPSDATAASSVTVLDSSDIGNGVGADELFSVGGCLHSFHLARLRAERDEVARLLAKSHRKHSAARRMATEALRERQSALGVIWDAVTMNDDEGDEDVEAADDSKNGTGAENSQWHTESAEHAYALQHSVYLAVGADSSAALAEARSATPDGSFAFAAEHLAPLFPAGSALPLRVALPLPADASVAIYLLRGDGAATCNAATELSVVPLTATGLTVPRASLPETADAHAFAVFTARMGNEQEDGHRRVTICVQTVVGRSNETFPALLTPHNTKDVAELVV